MNQQISIISVFDLLNVKKCLLYNNHYSMETIECYFNSVVTWITNGKRYLVKENHNSVSPTAKHNTGNI